MPSICSVCGGEIPGDESQQPCPACRGRTGVAAEATGDRQLDATLDAPKTAAERDAVDPTLDGVGGATGNGEWVWEDNSPFAEILHGQWSCPSIGEVDGKAQVYMAGGNGWLYAFEPLTGEPIWRFDLNPKDATWELGGRGTRNSIFATPVFFENSVLLAMIGCLCRLIDDMTRRFLGPALAHRCARRSYRHWSRSHVA